MRQRKTENEIGVRTDVRSRSSSYGFGEDVDKKKPKHLLAADRSLSGFEYAGLPGNTACFTINMPGGGGNARWTNSLCHGAGAGNFGLADGSIRQVNDSALLKTILDIKPADTVDGTLRFYLP